MCSSDTLDIYGMDKQLLFVEFRLEEWSGYVRYKVLVLLARIDFAYTKKSVLVSALPYHYCDAAV